MATTHQRTLTIPENELLMHAFHTDPEVVGLCKLNPEDMPQWVELNLLLACELLPLFLKRSDTEDYLQAMLNVPITGHSIEFVHHLATCPDSCCLSNEFLHMYISKSILSCEILNKGAWQDRQVKLVTNFIQSFLEKHIIPMEEYLVEIQSFCIGYLRFKGVAVLFRMVSNQVQKTDYEIGKVLPIDQLAGPSSSSRPSHSPGP
ncbi:hypothetical protein BDF14DRAFT_1396049 [Spinellus fusiger]|nr:hypothetical protein BDF14DRAFT_1396049 [Spinellus fusiger]